jgi:hypothetical protein
MSAKPRKPKDFTPARYDTLTMVGDARVVVTRNGALEPHGTVTADDGQMSNLDGHQLNLLWTLFDAKLIDFSKRGMYGLYLGDAVLTDAGHTALESWTIYAESRKPGT